MYARALGVALAQKTYDTDESSERAALKELLSSLELDGVLIQAHFSVDRYPVLNGDLVFHRYEGVLLPGRASYRYFVVGTAAGMVLTPSGIARTKLKGRKLPDLLAANDPVGSAYLDTKGPSHE